MARGSSSGDVGIRRTVEIPALNGCTMMGWVRPIFVALQGNDIFGIGGGGSVEDRIAFARSYDASNIRLYVQDGTNTDTVLVTEGFEDRYYHLAFVSHGGSDSSGAHFVSAYVDGRLACRIGASNTLSNLNWTTLAAVGTPSWNNDARQFTQNVRLWTRPLSGGEINSEMRARFAVSRQGLYADLPLIHDETDLVQRGAWTVSGTFTTEPGPILGGPASWISKVVAGAPTITCVTWGEPGGTSWQVWHSPGVSGDQDWGSATVSGGGTPIGPVVDTGDTTSKRFTITLNQYGSGGVPDLSIRGSASSFLWDDGSPAWATYTAPVRESWRYVQFKMTSAP